MPGRSWAQAAAMKTGLERRALVHAEQAAVCSSKLGSATGLHILTIGRRSADQRLQVGTEVGVLHGCAPARRRNNAMQDSAIWA